MATGNNNHLSTIFLLVILGCLIYYLTIHNNNNNDNNIDSYQNNAMQKSMKDSTGSLGTQLTDIQLLKTMKESQEKSNMLNNVQYPVNTGNNDSIFNFAPNDDNITQGADLDNAFQTPLQNNSTNDVINLNQNTVKNYNSKDFLPQEINDSWFDTDFSQAKHLVDDSLINTNRYVIGINTVGQSLKNASYDIRGTVPNPKFSISPWNNSTYEPDYNIKPLC